MLFRKKYILLFLIAALIGAYVVYTHMYKKSYYNPQTTKVIIIGATSGIGKEMALEFARRGYKVGITGRRTVLLDEIQQKFSSQIFTRTMDIAQPEKTQQELEELIAQMGGMDIIVINAGVLSAQMTWPEHKKMIDVNVTGFLAIATQATDYFMQQGHGQIVGISSIAALRGLSFAPAYSATKAFISTFLDGLRARFKLLNIPITVTTIEPGLIDTDMGKGIGTTGASWVERAKDFIIQFLKSSSQQAAVHMCNVIEAKNDHAYSPSRWRVIAWSFKFLPDQLLNWTKKTEA